MLLEENSWAEEWVEQQNSWAEEWVEQDLRKKALMV